ncbi:hypothetical protein niasHS_008042 [Heterodera schachtii]|uniref:Fucosyltransferase n=1 Tax=Heterodera schachtii TaxID=97005 RepID=A0ABD2J808_HETSC
MQSDSVQLVECSSSSHNRPPSPADIRWPLSAKSAQMFKWHFLFLFLAFSVVLLCWVLYVNACDDFMFQFKNDSSQNSSDDYAFPTKPVILMWTSVFGQKSLKLGPGCPFFDQCFFTYQRRALAHADAVVYHVPDIKWTSDERPDFPEQILMPANVKNVFLTQENPSALRDYHHAEKLRKAAPNFFHWTMTYLHSSDFVMPYGGFWISPEETLRLGFSDKIMRGAVWFVSNCRTESKRELAVDALSKHMLISIGGKCAKTEQGKKLCPRNATSCDHVFSAHYFFIAAENDICKDYVTEKYWDRYHLPSVPIVMRKHIYEGIVPNNSFIAMDQYESPKAMADHLNFLMDNPDEYLKYFEWRAQNWSIAPWNHRDFLMAQCALCERLLRNRNQSSPTKPTTLNAVEWFERNSKCEGDKFANQWANGK